MKKPNFFIIGAPKCGTTSLAVWLAAHPSVFFSSPKEPHYFSEEASAGQNLTSYERLFAKAKSHHKAVGEGSTSYLYSPDAVPNILKYNSSTSFIVCLRNPVDMVYSWHSQLLSDGLETETNFTRAWDLQTTRSQGNKIPFAARKKSWRLAYGPQCQLGRLMNRLYECVPKERVFPILLDDMKLDPRSVYSTTLEFLGLDDDGRDSFPVINASHKARSLALAQLFRSGAEIKKRLGIRRTLHLASIVSRHNVIVAKRDVLCDEMREKLIEYFYDDIHLLENLLGRDLSSWLT